MKKIALLAVAFLAGSTAFAQTTSTTTTNSTGPKWGLKVGVNLPKYSFHVDDGKNPETGMSTNFHVTGYGDIPISSNFSFQPGLSLQGKGAELYDDDTFEIKDNTMWIEVPLNLVAKLPISANGTHFFLGAGPYAAYGIAGERTTKYKEATLTHNKGDKISEDIEFGDKEGKDLKSLDLGVNFLGGVQLSNGFNIGAGYGLGINDLRPKNTTNDGKLTNRVLSFSLGYSF